MAYTKPYQPLIGTPYMTKDANHLEEPLFLIAGHLPLPAYNAEKNNLLLVLNHRCSIHIIT